MKREFKKGIKNIIYSIRATSFQKIGFPKVLPRAVWIGVTYICNSKCKMCSIWKRYKKNPELLKKEMTTEEFYKFVEKNRFLRDIALSGGEPFMKQDISKMWLYLDKKGYSTGTSTNAILTDYIIKIEEKILKDLSVKNSHVLQISIDGLGKEHDRVRGTHGLFDKAVKLVKWGIDMQEKKSNFLIEVSHTITSHNYKKLLDFIDFFVNLGLKPNQISFRTAQFSSSFYGNTDSKEIFKENKEIVEEIKKVMQKYPFFRKEWFYQNMINYLKDPQNFRIPCYAATSFAYIDPYWDVYPCIIWPNPIGNLRNYDFSLEKLWESKEAKEVRKLIKEGKCSNCWTGCTTIPSRVSNPKLLIPYYIKGLSRT